MRRDRLPHSPIKKIPRLPESPEMRWLRENVRTREVEGEDQDAADAHGEAPDSTP